MIARIAWRNIWRNKSRSIVIMTSVAVGLWAGVFIIAFSWGMYQEHIHNVIDSQYSHIQIHTNTFEEDKEVSAIIPDGAKVIHTVSKIQNVKAASGHLIISGMLTSPTGVAGIRINGIDPQSEPQVTNIYTTVTEGHYPDSSGKNPILIGEKLARKLKVRIKSKVVITFQDINGVITAGAFRIVGIYKTRNSTIDEMNAYVRINDLSELAGIPNQINEVVVLLHDDKELERTRTEIRNRNSLLKVQTWKELSPELELIIDSFGLYMYIFVGIILFGLMFGVVNIMLMAVLERTRELGVLMAIGMNKTRIFLTILIETFYLVMVGVPVGLLLAWGTVEWTGTRGIDISNFDQGLSAYGFSPVIHPAVEPIYYFNIALMTVGAAMLSALYPALRAIKLKPTEAIRKI